MTKPIIPAGRDENRLYRLLNASSEGLCDVDAEGRCAFINAAGGQMLGLNTDTMFGRPLGEVLRELRSEGQTSMESQVSQSLLTRETVRGVEAVFRREDGTALPVLYSVLPNT